MKVMTEERFKELIGLDEAGDYVACINDILEEFQELDQLTVTKFRPMSEAPRGEYILLRYKKPNPTGWVEGKHYGQTWNGIEQWWADCAVQHEYHFAGWIPLPRYEPEQV